MDADQEDAWRRFAGGQGRVGTDLRSRRDDPLQSVNLLELCPVRCAQWCEVDGRVVIERPRPAGRGLRLAADWLSFWMSTRRIRLDARGSYVWTRLDGGCSVQQLADEMRAEFGDEIEPAEERLGLLIRQLRSQELVVYPGWDEAPASGAPLATAERRER